MCVRKVCLSLCKALGLRKKKSYKGGQEVEEDEAGRITALESVQQSQDQHKLAARSQPVQPPPPVPQPPKPPKTQIKVTEEELFEDIGKDVLLPTETKPIEDRREPVFVEDLLSSTPTAYEEPVIIPAPQKKQPEVVLPPMIQTSSFRINLEPYEKYYALLEEKSRNLKDKLNIAGTIVAIDPIGETDLQIRHTQADKVNIFVYSFRLPCTYSFYNGMLNDYSLQKRMDNNIDEYRMLELITNNARVNYLSYKKVLIVSPRDFIYMKYSNSWENEYWDLSFSVPHEVYPSKVRGEIILSACKITQDNTGIQIQVYSEVDMKLTVSPKITKNQAVSEIRKYVERSEQYVRNTYHKQMV